MNPLYFIFIYVSWPHQILPILPWPVLIASLFIVFLCRYQLLGREEQKCVAHFLCNLASQSRGRNWCLYFSNWTVGSDSSGDIDTCNAEVCSNVAVLALKSKQPETKKSEAKRNLDLISSLSNWWNIMKESSIQAYIYILCKYLLCCCKNVVICVPTI